MTMKKGLIKVAMAVGAAVVFFGIISLLFSCEKKDNKQPANNSGNGVPANGDSGDSSPNDGSGNVNGETAGADLKVVVSADKNFFEAVINYLSQAGDLQKITIVDETGETFNTETNLEQAGLLFPFEDESQVMEMYIYWGAEDLGPSEALLITNEKSLAANSAKMKEWEKYMINDLKKFILIGEKYDLVEASGQKEFKSSQRYKNTRFVNFTQDEAVSLNYTVGDNFILIANSVSIQDKMLQKIAKDLGN